MLYDGAGQPRFRVSTWSVQDAGWACYDNCAYASGTICGRHISLTYDSSSVTDMDGNPYDGGGSGIKSILCPGCDSDTSHGAYLFHGLEPRA